MLILLSVYILCFFILGIFSFFSVKNPDDFYVAGQKGSLLNVCLSLLATILGSSAILGTISLSQKTGWAASWMMLSAALGLCMLIPLAGNVRHYGAFTLPDLLEIFYGLEIKCIACLFIPIAWIGVIAAQVIGSAKIITFITPLSYTTGAIVAGTLFTSYTLLGGQIAILKSDKWQGILILLAFTTAVSATFFSHGLPDAGSIPSSFPFNETFRPVDLLILLLTYASTFLVGPDIYSRLFCARDERTAKLSVMIVALILIPIGFILAWVGITGYAFSFDFLKHGVTPFIVMLGLFSAVLSSADTTLLTASATFSELFADLHQHSSLKLSRVLIIIFGFLSVVVALVLPNIIQTLLLAFSFFSGAFIIPTLAGLLGFRTTKHRVLSAVVIGGILALGGKILLISNYSFGNILIVAAFIINAGILFSDLKNKPA